MQSDNSGPPRLFGDQILERLPTLWAIIFYMTLALSLAYAVFGELRVSGIDLLLVLGLCLGSVALFERVYRNATGWPLSSGRALSYFGGQFLIVIGLLILTNSFIGLVFAVMGQSLGSLRPRWWAVVLVPFMSLVFIRMNWQLNTLANWFDLATLLLILLIWLAIGGLLYVLFGQRGRLLTLVAELRRAKAELEHAAAQQEELALLRERTRLARTLHDSVGHALVTVNVKLEAAERLYQVDPHRGAAELEATRALVRTTMGEIRHSIADLRAPTNDHRDLCAALQRLAEDRNQRAKNLDYHVLCATTETPPAEIAETLYLIAREALENVERHARASHVTLTLRQDQDSWSLEVLDDGIGIRNADVRKPGHFGIIGMRERIEEQAGHFQIGEWPGGGTRILVVIPQPARQCV